MIYSRFKLKKNRTMKAIIIYVSTYQSNTLKVAQRMANELSAFLATTREAENIDLSDYDLIGLGSGINFAQHHCKLLSFAKSHEFRNRNVFIFSTRCRPFLGKYHQALKRILSDKGGNLIGEFSCKGFDRTGPWVAINGYNKARPNEKDLFKAKLFADSMKRRIHPLAKFSKMKKFMIDKIDYSPIYKHPSNANKIAGKTTLLNITTCIHCMKCINLCPMHVFEIKEYDNSRIILPTGESNCIQCQTCSRNCPTNSIFINESFINGIWIAIREAGSDKLQQAYRYY